MIAHFQFNNPTWPDAHPWDAVLLAAVAAAVVWANRETMLRRGAGVTAVLAERRRAPARAVESIPFTWVQARGGGESVRQ